MYEDLPKTKKECIELGLKHYFTGKPCSRGHIDKRNKHGTCVSCTKENNAKRDQSTPGAKIGRPKGSLDKKPRAPRVSKDGLTSQQRRLAKRASARLDKELKKEFKRLERERKAAEAKNDQLYVRCFTGASEHYRDPSSGKLAIKYTHPDGFETHCFMASVAHSYDIQRAEGKLDRYYSDGSTTADSTLIDSDCGIKDCAACLKDKQPNNLSLLYDSCEKVWIHSLGMSI